LLEVTDNAFGVGFATQLIVAVVVRFRHRRVYVTSPGMFSASEAAPLDPSPTRTIAWLSPAWFCPEFVT
jgi:hypothetical protein